MKAKKVHPVTALFDFEINDNHVTQGGKNIYLYRFFPPNLSIFTEDEKETEIQKLCIFFDNIFMPFQIFAMDKVEDLSKNRRFFEGMDPAYSEYTGQIIEQISSIEQSNENTNSVQRAYYFIIQPKNAADRTVFEEAMRTGSMVYYPVEKAELVTVLRNYILREFIPFDLYYFEQEGGATYDAKRSGKKTARKKANQGTVYPVRPDPAADPGTDRFSASAYPAK